MYLSCLVNDYTYKSACLTVTCSILFWFYGTCISSEKKPNCHYFLICFPLPFHHFSNTFLLGFLSQRCTHSSLILSPFTITIEQSESSSSSSLPPKNIPTLSRKNINGIYHHDHRQLFLLQCKPYFMFFLRFLCAHSHGHTISSSNTTTSTIY